MFRALPRALTILITATYAACAFAEDGTSQQDGGDADVSARRFKALQEAVAAMAVTSEDVRPESALKWVPKPLLRFGDPTRRLLDAGVWRLGEEGRPTALLALEIYPGDEGRAYLQYEFVSLTLGKFSVRSPRGAAWDAAGTDLEVRELPDAPDPAKTPPRRLVQMRELVRRFTADETLGEDQVECRLLTQPIDRYRSPDAGIVDGAIFVFANGTNPEVGLLLETDGETWRYGAFRMAGARCDVQLDGRTVTEFPVASEITTTAERNTYNFSGYHIDLPQ